MRIILLIALAYVVGGVLAVVVAVGAIGAAQGHVFGYLLLATAVVVFVVFLRFLLTPR